MSRRTARLVAYLPALTWAAVILFIGTRSKLPGPPLGGHLDKVAHFSVYGVLGALAAWGWIRSGRQPHGALVLGAVLLLGILEEVLQTITPGRHGDVLDWLADAAGAATGFLIMARVYGSRAGKTIE
jgi:VanZ family protein